jgi:branched-chain amino acid aminotransferase
MDEVVNIDGVITDAAGAMIPVFDRGFLYGDSVYEVVRTYGGAVFALEEHMTRLVRSAAGLELALPDQGWLRAQIAATIEACGNAECYCRVIVTRGSGPLTLDPTTARSPRTVIIAKRYEPFPEWTYRDGVALTFPSIRRTSRRSLDPSIKSGNYLNSVLALGEARRGGFFDAIMLDHRGMVTEATSSNVFALRGGTLCTPSLEHGLLAGVTRGILIGVARGAGLEVSERELTVDDLIAADEVMLTSTLREVMPVVRIDDAPIADGRPGPVAARLKALFHEHALARTSASL